jgi:hypothetical protein
MAKRKDIGYLFSQPAGDDPAITGFGMNRSHRGMCAPIVSFHL